MAIKGVNTRKKTNSFHSLHRQNIKIWNCLVEIQSFAIPLSPFQTNFLTFPSNHSFCFSSRLNKGRNNLCCWLFYSLCKCHWGGGRLLPPTFKPLRNGFRRAELNMKCCWNCLKKSPICFPFFQCFTDYFDFICHARVFSSVLTVSPLHNKASRVDVFLTGRSPSVSAITLQTKEI